MLNFLIKFIRGKKKSADLKIAFLRQQLFCLKARARIGINAYSLIEIGLLSCSASLLNEYHTSTLPMFAFFKQKRFVNTDPRALPDKPLLCFKHRNK